MLIDLLTEYIELKFEELNLNLDNTIKLNRIVSDMDIQNIADNEKYLNYQIYLESVKSNEHEFEGLDNVTLRIDFFFLTVNKNFETYRNMFDRYVWNFRRLLKTQQTPVTVFNDSDISYGININDILNVNIVNADLFDNDIYKPSINLELLITDFHNENNSQATLNINV